MRATAKQKFCCRMSNKSFFSFIFSRELESAIHSWFSERLAAVVKLNLTRLLRRIDWYNVFDDIIATGFSSFLFIFFKTHSLKLATIFEAENVSMCVVFDEEKNIKKLVLTAKNFNFFILLQNIMMQKCLNLLTGVLFIVI